MIRNSRYNTNRSRTRTGVSSSNEQKIKHGPEPKISKNIIKHRNPKVKHDTHSENKEEGIKNDQTVSKEIENNSSEVKETSQQETRTDLTVSQDQSSQSQEKKIEQSQKNNSNELDERLNKLKERLKSNKYSSDESDSNSDNSESSESSSNDSDSEYESRNQDLGSRNKKHLSSDDSESSSSSDDENLTKYIVDRKKLKEIYERSGKQDTSSKNSSKVNKDLGSLTEEKSLQKPERRSRDRKEVLSNIKQSVPPSQFLNRRSESPEKKQLSKQSHSTYSKEKVSPRQNYYDDETSESDDEELSAFDEVPRAAFLKLIKNGGATSVSADAAVEIRDIMQDFIENMFEILLEKSSSIDTSDIKHFMNNYIQSDEELPSQLVIRQSDFERAIGKICDKHKARVRRDAIYSIHLLAETVIYKVVEGGLMVAEQCRQQRLSEKHLSTSYKIYML